MADLSWNQKRDNLVKSIDGGAGRSYSGLNVLWLAVQRIAGDYQLAKNIAFLGLPRCDHQSIRSFLVNLR